MNERIKELAEQAGVLAGSRKVDITSRPDIGILTPHVKYICDQEYIQDNIGIVRAVLEGHGLQKFAELIIKECSDQVRMLDSMIIKQHFGISE